VTNRMPEAE